MEDSGNSYCYFRTEYTLSTSVISMRLKNQKIIVKQGCNAIEEEYLF